MSNNEPQDPKHGAADLQSRLSQWLSEEGYPTEFRTASVFQRHGFRVFQGYYVRDDDSNTVREIDVFASRTKFTTDYLVRAYHVVECKWSQDKPWVVFTSPTAHVGSAACVAQTIGSSLGRTVLWALAGDESLHKMDLFSTPERPGFNGRQAFSKGNDHFYSAMKSVTSLASLAMREYDDKNRPKGKMPRNAVVAFPVIVVDGQLFEAFYNADEDAVRIEPVERVRCHWRGAPSWDFHATIDIVSICYLDDFVAKRVGELNSLIPKMENTRNEIAQCFDQRTLAPLTIPRAARGMVGLPWLLREARAEEKTRRNTSDDSAS